MLAVDDDKTVGKLKEDNVSISSILARSNRKDVNKQYPKLKLGYSPAYVLFDKNGLVYKTYDYDKLVKYVEKHSKPQ